VRRNAGSVAPHDVASPRPRLRLVSSPAPSAADAAPVQPPDPADVEQLFRAFAPYVLRIALRILAQRDEAEDVVQEVFLEAHRSAHRVRDPGAIRGWLATIAVRRAGRRLRRRGLFAWLGLERAIDPDVLVDPDASAEDRAQIAAVYRVLDRVGAEARAAWVMRCVEGEPLEVVAEALGCSRATAHRRVRDAQLALEGALGDA
jgi:RNA polymerase sigma-70 factor (ECF subfamily)